MKEKSLDPQKLDQMKSNLESGMKILSSNYSDFDNESPAETMETLSRGIADGTVFMLEAAAVLTDCLQRATDWKLVSLVGEKFTGMAVVSPDGAYALYPELVVAKALRKPREHILKQYFKMINGGSLPPSEPGRYTVLS